MQYSTSVAPDSPLLPRNLALLGSVCLGLDRAHLYSTHDEQFENRPGDNVEPQGG
jgi:hypothetical protein